VRPSICAAPPALVLGEMGRHPQRAQIPDAVERFVATAGTEHRRSADTALQHRQRHVSFGLASDLGQFEINAQAVAVRSQQMSQVTDPRLWIGNPSCVLL